MPLTEVAIKALKPGEKISRHYDERGLYLEISPAGGRWWRFKYTFGGKEKRLSLGVYPDVSLKEARGKRDAFRQLLAGGVDPGAQRREEKAASSGQLTFEAAARQWFDHWKNHKTEKHQQNVMSRLEADVFPEIGSHGIDTINPRQVVECVQKIERRGVGELAGRQLGKINQIYRWAIANDKAERNPAADIKPADILKPRKVVNQARVPAGEFPDLLRAIEKYDGAPITRLAIQFMTLTFVRTGELIGAEWPEIEGDVWRIPPERMKMKSPHLVPLSRQARKLLEQIREISGEDQYLFPGERRGCMSNNTILYALYRMGYKSRMTGHGFRGLASTILHEQGWSHEHIELQLAHAERDEVSAAYNHALYLKPRAKMMQAWADYLDGLVK